MGRIAPTVESAIASGRGTIDEITEIHVQDTIGELISRSSLIETAVKTGKLAVVGATYRLAQGRVTPIVTIGDVK